jgi:RNA polymerase sigma-70 factor, ECF subfamily
LQSEYLMYITTLNISDFRTAMEDYADDVWNYAYVLTRKKELADDIAQETFIKAFRSFSNFREEASLKTWLFKITRNTWLSYRKSAFIRKVTLVQLFADNHGIQQSAEQQYMQELVTDQIWEIVFQLPTKYREILLLQAHHMLSIKEISNALGISENASKSRLRRAKEKALDMMNQRGGLL